MTVPRLETGEMVVLVGDELLRDVCWHLDHDMFLLREAGARPR